MELWQYTASELAKLIQERRVSSVETIQSHLERIDVIDPQLHSFLTVLEDGALVQAARVDDRLHNGEQLPLAGLPIAIKDNINLAGVRTTCGSRLLSDYISPYSATVVQRLISAGAVVVGKTNMDEFAMGSSTEYSAYGPTHNPWVLERVPGGSSGGSAAAVAAGLVPLALGSDTGGSVRQPASFCGVVGLKPTYGRVSRYGLVAFASSLDQIGLVARTVSDSALLMNVIAGRDPLDSTSVDVAVPDHMFALKDDLRSIRLGVPTELMETVSSPSVRAALQKAIGALIELGATVDACSITSLPETLAAYQVISSAEASTNLARYDGIRYGQHDRSVSWDMGFEELVIAARSSGFGPEVKRRIMLGSCVLSREYGELMRKAEKVRSSITVQLEALFGRFDALLAPTSPTVAFAFGAHTDDQLSMHSSDILTIPANLAGIPSLSVPCGLSDDLPVGLQIMGKRFSEALLLRIASAYERAVGFPGLPFLKAHSDLVGVVQP